MAPDAITPDPALPQPSDGVGFSSGVDGGDGGDTVVSMRGAELLRAAGGAGGLAGTGQRLQSEALSVSSMLFVRFGEIAPSGLVSILSGAWQSTSIPNLGDEVGVSLFVVFEAGGVAVGEYTGSVAGYDPDGVERDRVRFPITVAQAGDILRIPRFCELRFAATKRASFGASTTIGARPRKTRRSRRLGHKRARVSGRSRGLLSRRDHPLRSWPVNEPVRLPRAHEAVIPTPKLVNYALDPTHERGQHKARVFASALGITTGDWRYLHDQILSAVPTAEVRGTRITPFGVSYEVVVVIDGLNGKTQPVVTTWMLASGAPPRLTSTWVDIP
jgi:hypothetical protein